MTKLLSELQGRCYVHKDHMLFTRAANIKQSDRLSPQRVVLKRSFNRAYVQC